MVNKVDTLGATHVHRSWYIGSTPGGIASMVDMVERVDTLRYYKYG